jgi:type IV pilus assembly protein PilW
MKKKNHRRTPGKPAAICGSGGFTLIEVLCVIGVLSILFGSVYNTFGVLNRAYTTENVKALVQQRTRIGVEFMVRDIRLAGLDPLGTADAGIVAALPTRIEVSADTNYDGDVADPFEDITYTLNGSNLEQINHLGQEILLDHVVDLTFLYLDAQENNLIDYALSPPQVPNDHLGDIRTVVISLTMQRPAGRDEQVSRTYTTRVRCRNL